MNRETSSCWVQEMVGRESRMTAMGNDDLNLRRESKTKTRTQTQTHEATGKSDGNANEKLAGIYPVKHEVREKAVEINRGKSSPLS